MIILRQKQYNKSIKSGLLALGSIGLLSSIKPERLTGKVVRYHNTEAKNVDSIMKEGLKTKHSEDPDNLTNLALKNIDIDKKKGLIYTSKSKRVADKVGEARERTKTGSEENASKNNKTIKLVFDYDEIKNNPKIENPELRGAKDWKEYKKIRKYDSDKLAKKVFRGLNDETHIFNNDIDSSHIVGGKGYEKRKLKQILKYIKNNPGRFGKEAAKLVTGIALSIGAVKTYKKKK